MNPSLFTKIATLVVFAVLLVSFLAYRAGLLDQENKTSPFLQTSPNGGAINSGKGKDSTKTVVLPSSKSIVLVPPKTGVKGATSVGKRQLSDSFRSGYTFRPPAPGKDSVPRLQKQK